MVASETEIELIENGRSLETCRWTPSAWGVRGERSTGPAWTSFKLGSLWEVQKDKLLPTLITKTLVEN